MMNNNMNNIVNENMEMVECIECGKEMPIDKAIYCIGDYYCQECADYQLIKCADCGEYEYEAESYELILSNGTKKTVCKTCSGDYNYCFRCEVDYHIEERNGRDFNYIPKYKGSVCGCCNEELKNK